MKKYDTVTLLEVDVLKDFCDGGALAVTGAEAIIDPINALHDWVHKNDGLNVLIREQHPDNTKHFDKWPKHGVVGTEGAEFHDDLKVADSVIVNKGTGQEDDGYSGFEGTDSLGRSLEEIIRANKKLELAVIIGGLATDYCVKATVLDALGQVDGDIYVPLDTMAAVNVNPDDGEKAIEEMRNGIELLDGTRKGAIFCQSADILEGRLFSVER